MMRSEKEIRELKEELEKITENIAIQNDETFYKEDVAHAFDVTDVLSWILKEIPTSEFRGEEHLRMQVLYGMVKE